MNPKKTMNKSQLFMLLALGVLGLFVVVLVGLSRGSISHSDSGDVGEKMEIDFSSRTSGNFELNNFHSVILEGTWEVELIQGENWQVELSYPQDLEDEIVVEVEENRLVLNSGKWYMRNWGWLKRGMDTHTTARIIMPELQLVEIKGATNLEFSGFEGENLAIIISGAGNVEGDDGHFDELSLTMSGAGNVDLRDVTVVDAEVILSGAGNVELRMDGGELSGNLSGFGNIEYSGPVRNERVRISGFGSVEERNRR